ncbi:MAG: ferrochelatase [Bacteroidales bacterium]|nr:ferrochelatase [Bacteroidales bacterium]
MKTALIIINYGTPQNASRWEVARYLRQLLDNKHVMTMNTLGRKILVNCIIAPLRSKRSAKLYAKIFKDGEMPLQTYTREFAIKLQVLLEGKADVFVAMTSGYSLVGEVLEDVLSKNYTKIVVAPMFPQYTESTWGKALDDVFSALRRKFNVPPVVSIDPFYDDYNYLDAMCQQIAEHLPQIDSVERIVFSYHGIPVLHTNMAHPGHTCGELGCADAVNDSNKKCYLAQCHEQTRLIASRMNIPADKCITTFQSRLTDRWVQPFTDTVVRQLASDGVSSIAMVTPSFTVDCLETIVEVGETLRNIFLQNGGKNFVAVPCLNSSDVWTENFCKIVEKSI